MFIENQWLQLAIIVISVFAICFIIGAFSLMRQIEYSVSQPLTFVIASVAAAAFLGAIYGYMSAITHANWGVLTIAICVTLVSYWNMVTE